MINRINRFALNYVLPTSRSLTIYELCKPRDFGIYNILDKNSFILYVKQVVS